MDDVITHDAWLHELVYTGELSNYTLGSAGKDGGSSLTVTGTGGVTHNFDDDIIFRMGAFIQWPEGTQDK